MKLNFVKFYKACNPTYKITEDQESDNYLKSKLYQQILKISNAEQTLLDLAQTITQSKDKPTYQLLSGYMKNGKSTGLRWLKGYLEQLGFEVVFCNIEDYLDMSDVLMSEILLAIALEISKILEKNNLSIEVNGLKNLIEKNLLIFDDCNEKVKNKKIEPTISNCSSKKPISFLIDDLKNILIFSQFDFKNLFKLRNSIIFQINEILNLINNELINPLQFFLKKQGKQGIVMIVDQLNIVENSLNVFGKDQAEYLFLYQGQYLCQLNCHCIYTIPLTLVFSDNYNKLKNRFGIQPKLMPIVPVETRNGETFEPGINLLREIVLNKAFPELEAEEQLTLIPEIFDSPKTLDRLCQVSGGYLSILHGLLYSCIQEEDPPFQRNLLESVIKEYREDLIAAISEDEWGLLFQALEQTNVQENDPYQILCRSLFLFQYRDRQGCWYGINPVLKDTPQFQSWLESHNS